MIREKRILAVVPARGGSKGIPRKNLQPVGGIPLVARVGHLLKRLSAVDRAVVSTDCEEIRRVARESGLDGPFLRPPELSGDRVGDWEVLAHALAEVEAVDGVRYDVIVMLQPTCPLRRPEHVTGTIEKLLGEDLDSVWTVSETDPKAHPLKQLTLTEEGGLRLYDPAGAGIIARQQLRPVYHRNGAAYAVTRHCLLVQKTILGARAGALPIQDPLVNIDCPRDLRWAEYLLTA